MPHRMMHPELQTAEQDRSLFAERRTRNLLLLGLAVSMLVHIGIMIGLAAWIRPGRASSRGSEPVAFEFAVLQEEQLTELESLEIDDLLPESLDTTEELEALDNATALDPAVSAAELEVARSGSMPTLGGAGAGEGSGGLSGGGGGASFFGVTSRGTRFAYIVDVSASMGRDRKMDIAMRELARSIDQLPDFASFFLVLFSSRATTPPMQTDWLRARPSIVGRMIRWLNTIDPNGGTMPASGFHLVFALAERPDVIFFLTDGEIPQNTADLVADLNQHGAPVVVNTIAFGSNESQEQLRRIAAESGGSYRFIAAGGGP